MRWALGLLLVVGATSCGAMNIEKPFCKKIYRDCTDACAERCDTARHVDDSRRPPTIDDNDLSHAACADCVRDCRTRAERCDARDTDGS